MKNEKSPLIVLLTVLTAAGNILFVLWIFYNGMNEGFNGTMIEKISYFTLMVLLLLNTFLLARKGR